ncbi:MAG: hypothetical protein ABIY55_23310 [Kofleriaceae bacterium]
MQRLQDRFQRTSDADPVAPKGAMPGKSTQVSRQVSPATAGASPTPAPGGTGVAPVHDETTKGSQASKIDWSSKAGVFSLAAEKGMEDKTLYEVFLAKFKDQLATMSFKVQSYEQILAHRDELRAQATEDSLALAAHIDEDLWRARTYAIIETLKVTSSKRYDPTASTTYCNVYAYDVVTALGGYLPRVWWNEWYLPDMQSGAIQVVPVPDYREAQQHAKATGQATTPKALGKIASIWGETTHELSANDLAAWFNKWGASFGWRRTADMHEAQDAANGGKIVVISAGKVDSAASGHISVVIAEDSTLGGHDAPGATKVDPTSKKTVPAGGMGAPLQTQAGVTNFKYGDDKPGHWWDTPDMKQDVETATDTTGATKPVLDAETKKPVNLGHFWIYDGKEQASAIKPDAPPPAGATKNDEGAKAPGKPAT